MLYKFVDQRFKELSETIIGIDIPERLYWVKGTLRDPYFEMQSDIDDVRSFVISNDYEVEGNLGVVFTTRGESPRNPDTISEDKKEEFLGDINRILDTNFQHDEFLSVYTSVLSMENSMDHARVLKEKYDFIVPSLLVFIFLNNMESMACVKNSTYDTPDYITNISDYPDTGAIKGITAWVMNSITKMKQVNKWTQ